MFFVWLFFYGLISVFSRFFSTFDPRIHLLGFFLTFLFLIRWLFALGHGQLLTLKKRPLRFYIIFLLCFAPIICQFAFFGFQPQSTMAFWGIFFAVLQEELLFRGVILSFLCRKSPLFGVVCSALLFSAAHLFNLEGASSPLATAYQMLYALFAGFALSGLCLLFQSLYPCIVIHFFNNLMASDPLPLFAASLPLYVFSLILWFIAGLVCILYLRKTTCKTKGNANEVIY